LAELETIHLFAFLFLTMFAYVSESRRRGGRLSTFQLRGWLAWVQRTAAASSSQCSIHRPLQSRAGLLWSDVRRRFLMILVTEAKEGGREKEMHAILMPGWWL